MRDKITLTVLAVVGPYLFFAALGLLTGSLALGTPEIVTIWVVQVVGVTWIWVVNPLLDRLGRRQ